MKLRPAIPDQQVRVAGPKGLIVAPAFAAHLVLLGFRLTLRLFFCVFAPTGIVGPAVGRVPDAGLEVRSGVLPPGMAALWADGCHIHQSLQACSFVQYVFPAHPFLSQQKG